MDDMETSQVSETFAPRNDPAAQVPLPLIMSASKQHIRYYCAILAIAYVD